MQIHIEINGFFNKPESRDEVRRSIIVNYSSNIFKPRFTLNKINPTNYQEAWSQTT